MTVELTDEIANATIQLLNRVTLTPQEINAYLTIIKALQNKKQEKTPEPTEKEKIAHTKKLLKELEKDKE